MRETENSDVNWQLWCRLCAKDDPVSNVNIVFKDEQEERGRDSLSKYLYKYFGVQMDEALPKMLCTECFSFVTSLVNFAERVEKVQQMFQALVSGYDSKNVDFQAIRLQFGILDNEREQIFVPQTSLLEVHYFDSKPKIDDFEEKIFEDDVDATANPLEQQSKKSEEGKRRTDLDSDKKPAANKRRKLNTTAKDETDEDENYDIHNDASSLTSESDISEIDESLKIENDNEIKCRSGRQLRSSTGEVEFTGEDLMKDCNRSRRVSQKKRLKQKETEFTCTECSHVFKRVQQFRQHMKRIHSMSPNLSDWKCTHCPDRVFSTQSQLDKHLKVHLPPELKRTVPCPYCNKKFSSNSIMQAHIKYIHNNDRPFICEECGVTLRTNAALKAHMLTHTDYAPFECQVCKKGFKNQIRLKNHMETHDPHKHICAKCGLQLNSRATLNRHLLVHSDVMSHKCDYCGRAFKRAKALKNHLLLHTGLKPYSCDFCDRTFANGSNCRSHKKKAHPEELAALEASGGGKQYTRNIPKLEALKAVTKAADNLAPVVSKQSGCFAFGKKSKTVTADVEAFAKQSKNSLNDRTSDTIKSVAENSNPDTDNTQNPSASVPMIDNIYNQILKQASDTQTHQIPVQQNTNVLTNDLGSLSLPALQLQRQQLMLQSEKSLSQSQTSTSIVSNANLAVSNATTFGSQLSKQTDLPLTIQLRQQQQNQHTSTSFLCQNEMQEHQEMLGSVQSPESQTSHVSDEHSPSRSPSVPFYNHTRRDLQQGAFM